MPDGKRRHQGGWLPYEQGVSQLLTGNGFVSNNDIRNKLKEISSINKKVPDGGSAFRVERSRNIARQFELLIDSELLIEMKH